MHQNNLCVLRTEFLCFRFIKESEVVTKCCWKPIYWTILFFLYAVNRCKGVMEKPVQKSHSLDIDGGSTVRAEGRSCKK